MERRNVLKVGELGNAFAVYWNDMDRCRRARAYWSLLHVAVCLPDICAALQSPIGETSRKSYEAWCDQYLPDALLTGAERYRMRCRVLHQGRATSGQPGRYTGYSFGQPASNGQVDHRRVEGKILILDVGVLSDEIRKGVESWIKELEGNRRGPKAIHAAANLPSLVRVGNIAMPGQASEVNFMNLRTS